jgi:hypothetical protein
MSGIHTRPGLIKVASGESSSHSSRPRTHGAISRSKPKSVASAASHLATAPSAVPPTKPFSPVDLAPYVSAPSQAPSLSLTSQQLLALPADVPCLVLIRRLLACPLSIVRHCSLYYIRPFIAHSTQLASPRLGFPTLNLAAPMAEYTYGSPSYTAGGVAPPVPYAPARCLSRCLECRRDVPPFLF